MVPFLIAAAESGNEGGIAAIIAAIAALISAVFAGIYKLVQGYDGRQDKATGESMATMAAARDDALAGEVRLRNERDDARRETAKAYRERDRWMDRAQKAELELARGTRDTTGGDP
jgi:hypothetical protein